MVLFTSCQLKVDDTQILRLPFFGPPFTIVTIQFKKRTYKTYSIAIINVKVVVYNCVLGLCKYVKT